LSARDGTGIGMTSERTRLRMIDTLRREGVNDERVLGAMAEIPRHLFIDEGIASRAYEDVALPIGHGQTISSPTIVGLMTQFLLEKAPMSKVLEVGTGCGYQTAVLGKLVKEVYTLERIAPLMDKARRHLLAVGGRMVLPVGTDDQWLYVVDRTETGFSEQKRAAVRFVPLLPGLA